MSNTSDAIVQARSDAQAMHAKIQATTNKDHGAIRVNAKYVEAAARALAASVKTLAESQQSDAKQHLRDAASVIQDVAKHATQLASANDADLKSKNQALLQGARAAIQHLSQALAAKRAATRLVHS